MASGDRFYELQMKNRPVYWGDIGSLLKIDGLVVGGGGARAILWLPSAELEPPSGIHFLLHDSYTASFPSHQLSVDEWSEFLRLSDTPELLMPDKAFHRKARYEISGLVQQKIWVRDGLRCMYCFRKMGDVQLTIDHFIPLELGGENNETNYLSACRKCNKNKGSIHPKDFCTEEKYSALTFFLDQVKKGVV